MNIFLDFEIFEGKIVIIFCEVLGRSFFLVRMKRNGMIILELDGVYIVSRRMSFWLIFYVIFFYVLKEIKGNYFCVVESESRIVY